MNELEVNPLRKIGRFLLAAFAVVFGIASVKEGGSDRAPGRGKYDGQRFFAGNFRPSIEEGNGGSIMRGFHHPIILFCMLAGFTACSEKPPDSGTHHHGEEHSHEGMPSKPGRKFEADESLRLRMTVILNEMKAFHAADTRQDLPAVGRRIEATVQDIFKNCKLQPEADAALHPILAELLKGAGLLKEGKIEGHELIHGALVSYEKLFDHPGWDHSK